MPSKCILFLAQSKDITDLFACFREDGVEIVLAENLKGAMAFVKKAKPVLIFSRPALINYKAEDLLSQASQDAAFPPVIIFSAKPTADEASAAMRRFLQESGSLPDAVVASSGLILLGLVQALREADLRFPDDVALAGFDDMPWTRVVTPAITVMAQPTYDIGRSAIERLLARIAQPEQAVHRIVLRGELLVRGSSAAR